MFGSALYHPYIDIADTRWLKSAILFWDDIQTIAPMNIKEPYRSYETIVCQEEGYLKPLYCELHGDLLNELGKKVLNIIQNPSGPQSIGMHSEHGNPFTYELIHAHKIGDALRADLQFARISPDKMSEELRAIFPGAASSRDEGWLLVDSRFASAYMAALAATLAQKINASPLTGDDSALGVSFRCLLDETATNSNSQARGAIISFTLRALKIDPQVDIRKLLIFRRSRVDQLAELSARFSELSDKIQKCENAKELEEKAKEQFANKISPGLNSLKRELSRNSIGSVWEGIQRAITVSVPAAGALNFLTGYSGAALLGVGAVMTLTDVSVKSYLARQKSLSSSPYTYLFDVERKFSNKL